MSNRVKAWPKDCCVGVQLSGWNNKAITGMNRHVPNGYTNSTDKDELVR